MIIDVRFNLRLTGSSPSDRRAELKQRLRQSRQASASWCSPTRERFLLSDVGRSF